MSETKKDEKPALKLLALNDILQANDILDVTVSTPEWGKGGGVRLRSLNASQMAKFVDKNGKDKDRGEAVVTALMLSACDEQGNLLFAQSGPEAATQMEKLRGKNMKTFMRVQRAVMKLNGLDGDDEEEAKND